MFKYLAIILLSTLLVGCSTTKTFDIKTQKVAYKDLTNVKAPDGEPIIIAVYDFVDMTGQKKPGGNFASMSSAVTQGSYQLLIKALQDAGDGKWFRVVERSSLASLLQERKLIRTTRQMASGENAEPLPALLFAGAYITGGVVGYDSDIKSGGAGARVLGIQANKQYREDIVTIILRLVNVQTGEVVVISTTVEKTIVSTSTGGDVFKYFDADTMLVEIEAGYAKNEPVTFAVRKAIEKGVVDLIHLGAEKELWEFSADVVEVPEIKDYVDITTENEETSIEVLTETEKELVQENENKEWNDLETEEVKDENNDETIDTSNVHTN